MKLKTILIAAALTASPIAMAWTSVSQWAPGYTQSEACNNAVSTLKSRNPGVKNIQTVPGGMFWLGHSRAYQCTANGVV